MKQFLIILFILSQIAIPQKRFVDANNSNSPRDGRSWRTAWNSFAEFNINDLNDVPNGTTIKIAPGEYNTGHSTYYNTDDQTGCIIWIKNNRNLNLRLGDPSLAEEDDNIATRLAPAVFKGSTDYKRGILILPNSSSHSISSLIIKNLRFENFGLNSVKCRGYITTTVNNYVENIKIENCTFICTSGELGRNTAAVMFQYTDIATVEGSFINSTASDRTQNDGIYIDDSKNIIIHNNSITVNNSYSGPGNLQPHVDVIQITRSGYGTPEAGPGCHNITIYNNYLYNESDRGQGLFSHRQGLYVLFSTGNIRLYNNIIKSKRGSGLLNVWFNSGTTDVSLYNNTLYAENDQPVILGINNTRYDYGNVSIVKIKNNIIFKNNSSIDPPFIKYTNIPYSTVNNTILNNNLYYLGSTSSSNYRTAYDEHDPARPPGEEYFNYTTQPWNGTTTYRWEGNGRIGNPEFESISTDDFRIQYHSEAKNLGVGLKDEGITQDYYGNSRPYWNKDYDAGAFEIEDTQLKFGIWNTTTTNVTHTLTSYGTYWQRNTDGTYIISSDQGLTSAVCTTASSEVSADLNLMPGIEYKWLDRSNNNSGKRIAAGIYKATNNHPDNQNAHCYIDLRDAPANLNLYLRYDHAQRKYQFNKDGTWGINNYIQNGQVLRIWDVNSNGIPNNTPLPQFWQKSLVQVHQSGHPFLIWGQNGSAPYILRRRSGSNYYNFPSSYSLEKEDTDIIIGQPPPDPSSALYYSIRNAGNNDTEEILVWKSNIEKENTMDMNYTFDLNQNYPNPFNPSTTIRFSVGNKENIVIKIFDLLGNEVACLLNDRMEPGEHSINFNASRLSSGIYFCKMLAGNYASVRKMQLIK